MSDKIDVPGVALGQQVERPGYETFIPGECLKPGSKLWTPEQREAGIWLRMNFLTSSEEEAALREAERSGPTAVLLAQVRMAIVGCADNAPVTVEEDGAEVREAIARSIQEGARARAARVLGGARVHGAAVRHGDVQPREQPER